MAICMSEGFGTYPVESERYHARERKFLTIWIVRVIHVSSGDTSVRYTSSSVRRCLGSVFG